VRITRLESLVHDFAPWLLPQFANLVQEPKVAETMRPEKLTLEAVPRLCAALEQKLQQLDERNDPRMEKHSAVIMLRAAVARASAVSRNLLDKMRIIAERADGIAKSMDFAFLYDTKKKLLATGFNAEEDRVTPSHYDLLASEARAGTFVAIAKGEIPQESWFAMKRPYTKYKGEHVLLSWTGTMFEYLMPFLWMKSYPNTVLDLTAQAAIRCQKRHAEDKSIPWGMSEASCSKLAPDGHYHYEAFGVPGLAVSRELSKDTVVSPYSSFLSLLVDPSAMENIRKLKSLGLVGAYGFYEAVDFTPSRMTAGSEFEIVRCWLAHHQGMTLISVANVLCNSSSQRRFRAEPMVAATERLLHEKAPRNSQLETASAVDVNPESELTGNDEEALRAKDWGIEPKLNTAA